MDAVRTLKHCAKDEPKTCHLPIYRWRGQRESRPGRLGRCAAVRRTGEGDERRVCADYEQPDVIAGGDRGAAGHQVGSCDSGGMERFILCREGDYRGLAAQLGAERIRQG